MEPLAAGWAELLRAVSRCGKVFKATGLALSGCGQGPDREGSVYNGKQAELSVAAWASHTC